jgi:hypothetical protein
MSLWPNGFGPEVGRNPGAARSTSVLARTGRLDRINECRPARLGFASDRHPSLGTVYRAIRLALEAELVLAHQARRWA